MRSRARKVRLKSSPDELLAAGVLLDESVADGPLDLAQVFLNHQPVEVEIGPGKGGFLLSRAGARPELNLLGIEWVRSHAWYVADRARRAGLRNVRVLCADAVEVFSNCLAASSICRVHVYFPDPWPKRRQVARRLIQPGFLVHVHRTLQLGGQVRVVTDHRAYFRQVRWVFLQQAGLAEVAFPDSDQANSAAGTNFARKYRACGRALYAIAAVRWA